MTTEIFVMYGSEKVNKVVTPIKNDYSRDYGCEA